MPMIIKQPDGKFAVISYSVLALWNATHDEVVGWFVKQAEHAAARAVEQAEHRAARDLEKVKADRPSQVYGQFAMTWEEALRSDRRHDGEAHLEFPALPPDPCPDCESDVVTNEDGSVDCTAGDCDYHLTRDQEER